MQISGRRHVFSSSLSLLLSVFASSSGAAAGAPDVVAAPDMSDGRGWVAAGVGRAKLGSSEGRVVSVDAIGSSVPVITRGRWGALGDEGSDEMCL